MGFRRGDGGDRRRRSMTQLKEVGGDSDHGPKTSQRNGDVLGLPGGSGENDRGGRGFKRMYFF